MIHKPIKAIFIVNPISGKRSKNDVESLLRTKLSNFIDYEVVNWNTPDLFPIDGIIPELDINRTNIFVALGGDGTINQIGGRLAGTKYLLGIIPFGSGNGLARHLKIPIGTRAAIEVINKGKVKKIDTGSINGKPFFTTSGVGYDAFISELFSKSKNRGPETYVELVLTTYLNYTPARYEVKVDDHPPIVDEFFVVTVANANQYGNNAYIAPKANISDGLFDVVMIKKPPIIDTLPLGAKLFNRTIHLSRYTKTLRGKKVIIKREVPGPVHYDGEASIDNEILEFFNQKETLNVIIP